MLHLDDVGLDNPSTLDKGFEVVEVPGERSDRCCIHLETDSLVLKDRYDFLKDVYASCTSIERIMAIQCGNVKAVHYT
ncbi:hypothetical protein AB205_0156980, partial [Aquarana catesbeiana]